MHVADVADAFLRAIDPGRDGKRLNIGTGRQTDVSELHSLIARTAGGKDAPEMVDARPGELQAIALDAGAAQRELGWSVQWQIEDGLAQTVEWLRANSDGRLQNFVRRWDACRGSPCSWPVPDACVLSLP